MTEPASSILASISNFRDVAGSGYPARESSIVRGRIFRSNVVDVAAGDAAQYEKLGISVVYDLREQPEIDIRPDGGYGPARWIHAPVPGLSMAVAEGAQTPAEMRTAMVDHYRGFVGDARKRAGFATVLSQPPRQMGAQVFHCAEGKDRTGWLALLVQSIAGVPESDIVADYLLTNELLAGNDSPTLIAARNLLRHQTEDVLRPAMIADAEYLAAGLQQIDDDYGTMNEYLRSGLGLSDEDRNALCQNLTR